MIKSLHVLAKENKVHFGLKLRLKSLNKRTYSGEMSP